MSETPDPIEETLPRPAVSWRSVCLGMIGVVLICFLTPYNNYVVNNTDLVGNMLPTSVVLLALVVLLVNTIVRHIRRGWVLSRGELIVALSMVLVGCAFPAVGLMRYLPGHLVAPWAHAVTDTEARRVLSEIDPPAWLFPDFAGNVTDPVARGNDPVVTDFIGRIPMEQAGFVDRVRAIPWRAWLRPALTWGLFFTALFGAAICLMIIFREQWVVAERLPFPLASVWLSLVEPPPRDKLLNSLFRSRGFWMGAGFVVLVDLLFGLAAYFPEIPQIPLRFDLTSLLTEAPWYYVDTAIARQTIFFTIVGITFCMQGKVALSIWLMFAGLQVVRMLCGNRGVEFTYTMQLDQVGGSALVFFVMIVWLARRHLSAVGLQMFDFRGRFGRKGRYLPRGLAGWGFIVCSIIAIGWLVAAGASIIGAASIILLLMIIYIVLAKVVAETGLLYVLVPYPINRPWLYALQDLPGAVRTTGASYYFSSIFSGILTHDMRQSLPPMASHTLKLGDSDESVARRSGLFLLCLVAAMVTAYFVSGASSLYAHYHYAVSLDTEGLPLDFNAWSWYRMPREIGLAGPIEYLPPRNGPKETHSHLGHFGFGAAFTGVLSLLHLRIASFPLHPVGYLLVYTWGIRTIWFSVFLGWLCKIIAVRLGGSGLMLSLRPFFIGLIVGEAVAATIWMIVSLVLAQRGMEYHAIKLLP